MQEKKEISQKIIDYAIWYYLKYYPSILKLKQKLKEKFGPESEKGKKYGGILEEDIDFIIKEKLKNIIVEKEVINAKISNYFNRGKAKRYIKNKLFEKGFKKQDYEEILEEYFKNGEKDAINIELEKILKKLKIAKNFYGKKEVLEKLDFKQKQKITQKLVLKGFDFGDVLDILAKY